MRRLAAAGLAGLVVALWQASAAMACSPLFEQPTIRALGPAQVVVLGMTGERVQGGRLFDVQRWFNGGVPTTPIVIAFKEGEPTGDCSYPMGAGRALIIAPDMAPDGTLSANLVTLQGDPANPDGQRYLDEAIRLFGPGVIPVAAGPPVSRPESITAPADPPLVLAVSVGLAILIFAAVAVAHRWLQRRGPAGP